MNVEEIVNDFSRRYRHSYVLVQQPGNETKDVFYVQDVVGDADHGAVLQLSSEEYGSISINLASGHSLFFEYPNMGSFQHGKDAFFFNRIPARQYKRGICSENAAFLSPLNQLWPDIGRRQVWNWAMVKAAFDQKKYTLEEALSLLEQKAVRACALKDGYSITQPVIEGMDSYVLFYHDLPIGKVDQKGKRTAFETLFSNEVQNGDY